MPAQLVAETHVLQPQQGFVAALRANGSGYACNKSKVVFVGLNEVFRKTKRKTEGPQHFAFPEISRENRGCLVLNSGNSLFSLSLRAGLGQNLRQN